MRKSSIGRIFGLILAVTMTAVSIPIDVNAAGFDVYAAADEVFCDGEAVSFEDLTELNETVSDETVSEDLDESLETELVDEITDDPVIADDVTVDEVYKSLGCELIETDEMPDELTADGDADSLSFNGVTDDTIINEGSPASDRLKTYLREGADPDTLTAESGTDKVDALGKGVESQIFTYKNMSGSKTYRVLYIWSKDGTEVTLDKYQVCEPGAYSDKGYTTLTDIIMDDNIIGIDRAGIFQKLTGVDYVRFSPKVKSFSSSMFFNCTSLKEITIPKSLETVAPGGCVFSGCSSLKVVRFEDGIKKIPDYCLKNYDATNITDVHLKCAIEKVVIPSSVTDIGDQAFQNLTKLNTVELIDPANMILAHIGQMAFINTNLTGIALPKFGGNWTDPNDKRTHPAAIESEAFASIKNTAFKTFIIPEGVVSITDLWGNDFSNRWTEIYLPSTLERRSNSSNEMGLYEAFGPSIPPTLNKIYYNGSESQFFTKALGIKDKKWQETWKSSYNYVYPKIVFNTLAPSQVSAITVPADKNTILKYKDDVTEGEQETIRLTISPASHLDTQYTVGSSDKSIVEVTKGAEVNGELPITLKYHKKLGEAIITIAGGHAEAKIKVAIKDKDQVNIPVFKINGQSVGYKTKLDVKRGDRLCAESDTQDCVIKYRINSGSWKELSNGLVIGSNVFEGAADGKKVTVLARAFKSGLRDSEETPSLELTYKYDMGDVTPYDLNGRTAIPNGMWIAEKSFADVFYYTGSGVICPDLRVYCYNKLLKNGKDYSVKYRDNVDARTVSGVWSTLTVTGKGIYSGCTAEGSFEINRKEFTDADIYSYTPVNLTYKVGKVHKPNIGVIFNGRKLKEGKDYIAHYKRGASDAQVSEPGYYYVEIEGINNYIGKHSFPRAVCVVDATDKVNVGGLKVSRIADQQFEKKGQAIKPEFSVTYKKTSMSVNDPIFSKAFNVTYTDNKTAGTAAVILEGTGNQVNIDGVPVAFIGQKKITFKIKPAQLSQAIVTLTKSSYVYTGEAIEPDEWGDPVIVKVGDYVLVKDEDYTLSYKNNVKAGKAVLTVNGKGSYAGKNSANFTIEPAVLTNENVKLEAEEFNYTTGGVKPAVTVCVYGDLALPNKEYKIEYSGYDNIGTASVTVTGKGNLTGKVTKNYKIKEGNLSLCTTSFQDKIWSNKAKLYPQNLTIKDTNGKTLKAGKDYDKNFVYEYQEDTKVTQKTGKTAYAEIIRSSGDKVDDNDIIPAGTTIRVIVNGMGKFEYSELIGYFRFGKRNISSLKISVNDQKFKGFAIYPDKDQIKVNGVADGGALYDIVSYGANINKGTGTIVIRGRGECAGIRTLKFKINLK